MNFRNIAVSFGLLTMFGCKNIFEDNDVTLDGSTPHNTVASPAANHVYKAGEPLKLETSFNDKDNVAEIEVNIVSLAPDLRGSTSIVNFKRYPNKIMYKLDTVLAGNKFTPGNYQLLIRSVDTRQNEGTREVRFSVN